MYVYVRYSKLAISNMMQFEATGHVVLSVDDAATSGHLLLRSPLLDDLQPGVGSSNRGPLNYFPCDIHTTNTYSSVITIV